MNTRNTTELYRLIYTQILALSYQYKTSNLVVEYSLVEMGV